jgi:hypothetical protein
VPSLHSSTPVHGSHITMLSSVYYNNLNSVASSSFGIDSLNGSLSMPLSSDRDHDFHDSAADSENLTSHILANSISANQKEAGESATASNTNIFSEPSIVATCMNSTLSVVTPPRCNPSECANTSSSQASPAFNAFGSTGNNQLVRYESQ